MIGNDKRSNRRAFLAGGVAAAAGTLALRTTRLEATGRDLSGGRNHEGWIRRLTGGDRMLFDSPDPNDARMLLLMRHTFNTYQLDYDAADADVSVVGTFYGNTTFFGLDDSAWNTYRLGEVQGLEPAPTRNPWRADPFVNGQFVPTASIETLQGRGATFLLCRAALLNKAGKIAARIGANAEMVYDDLAKRILPGVVLVPSVIVAIQRAQKAGISYYRVV